MKTLFPNNSYSTPKRRVAWLARLLPSLWFWFQAGYYILHAARLSKRGRYSGAEWVGDSVGIVRALESVGVKLELEHLEIVHNLRQPCIFIANHMSTLETFVLPAIIQPYMDVTFVVKQQLIETPVFKHVMLSRDPVVVGRENPREDFKIVMEEGKRRLAQGVSIVVFPQTTRTTTFDIEHFNSIGVKLAKYAGVPIVPIALRTDAWANGKLVKDLGRIDPHKTAHFCFHEPISVTDNGKEQHQQIVDFITHKLRNWE